MQDKSEGRPAGTALSSVSSAASVADDLPMKPPYRYLLRGEGARYLLEHDWFAAEWCLVSVANYRHFWRLHEALTAHLQPTLCFARFGATPRGVYMPVRVADIPALRTELGKHVMRPRLEFRALPTRRQVLESREDG